MSRRPANPPDLAGTAAVENNAFYIFFYALK
jgi:hypothetical protein